MKRLGLAHVLLLFAALVPLNPLLKGEHDPDFFWHLKAGEFIWETRAVPRVDPFSFTMAGQPWTTHEWLFEAVLWGFYRTGQVYGLLVLTLVSVLLSCWLLWKLYTLRSCNDGSERTTPTSQQPDGLLPAVIVAIVVGLIEGGWSLRPFLLLYPLFLTYLYLLRRFKYASEAEAAVAGRWLWLLPVLMVIWVNAHSSFVVGVLLIVAELAFGLLSRPVGLLQPDPLPASRRRVLAGIGALTVLASGLNPRGFWMYHYTLTIATHKEMKASITEWLSPDFHQPFYGLILGPFLVLLLLTLLSCRDRLKLPDVVYLLGLLYVFLSSSRYLPFFMFYAGYVVAGVTGRSELLRRWDRPRVAWALLALWVLLLGIRLPPGDLERTINPAVYPVEATRFVEEASLQGPILNDYTWGGYLIWRWYPERRVFIDGRADLYLTSPLFSDYMKAARLEEDPRPLLERYSIRYALLRTDSKLALFLRAAGGWGVIHQDQTAVVLERP